MGLRDVMVEPASLEAAFSFAGSNYLPLRGWFVCTTPDRPPRLCNGKPT